MSRIISLHQTINLGFAVAQLFSLLFPVINMSVGKKYSSFASKSNLRVLTLYGKSLLYRLVIIALRQTNTIPYDGSLQ